MLVRVSVSTSVLSVRVSVHVCLCLFVRLSAGLFVCLFVFLSVFLSARLRSISSMSRAQLWSSEMLDLKAPWLLSKKDAPHPILTRACAGAEPNHGARGRTAPR